MCLLLYQEHPTTKSFQITQKFHYVCSGLFFNFELPKNSLYLFGCLRRTLALSKVLGCFFFSSEVLVILTGLVETVRTRSSHTFESQNLRGNFLFTPKFSGELNFIAHRRQIFGRKCELHFA